MDWMSHFVNRLEAWMPNPGNLQADTSYVLSAGALVLGGLFLAVFGARLMKYAVTFVFIAVGVALGSQFAATFNLPASACIPVGGLLIGLIGALTHRGWTGVLSGAVVGVIALSIFSYVRVWPHRASFESSLQELAQSADMSPIVTVESLDGLEPALVPPTPQRTLEQFWNHASAKDPTLNQYGPVITTVAVLLGIIFGLTLFRAALVISTSFTGSLFLLAGALGLMSQWFPNQYAGALKNPLPMVAVMGGFLAISLVLQTLMTRRQVVAAPGATVVQARV